MNIKDLKYLVALEECKHFGKAAEKCFVSQPTLSGQIKKLENELNLQLIERNNRRILFTPSGIKLVNQAKSILKEIETFHKIANNEIHGVSGPISIGVIPTVGPYLFPHIIQEIKQDKVDIFLHEDHSKNLLKNLEEGKLDCIIVASVDDIQNFNRIDLYREPMILAVSEHDVLCRKKGLSMSDLSDETFLMLDDGHCLQDQAIGSCFLIGKEDERFKSTSLETLRYMVAAGTGKTFMPKLATPKEKIRDGVCYIDLEQPSPSRDIVLVYRKNSPLEQYFEGCAKIIQNKINGLNL